MELLDIRMHDGSRQFASWSPSCSWATLRRHLEALPGLEVTDFTAEDAVEAWLDFTADGQRFSVHNPYGRYWFFVDDPATPTPVLRRIVDHCQLLFSERPA